MSPFVGLYQWSQYLAGFGAFGRAGIGTNLLLVWAGLIIVLPLILFTRGARRLLSVRSGSSSTLSHPASFFSRLSFTTRHSRPSAWSLSPLSGAHSPLLPWVLTSTGATHIRRTALSGNERTRIQHCWKTCTMDHSSATPFGVLAMGALLLSRASGFSRGPWTLTLCFAVQP
jgi:hypothetical protein